MLLLRTPTPSLWTFSARWLHRYLASPPPPSSLASSSLGSPYIGISRLTSTFVAILAFVFTYITVVCRGTSPSPPSSLPIYLSAFAHPPPATLASAPSPLAHCPLLAAAATYCICWEHPTLAPAVLTGTALLQLLLQLCLSCYSAADCTDFAGC